MIERKKTREVAVGSVKIGGGRPIAVQSMLNMPASDIEGNVAQAVELQQAGCEIVRVSIPDRQSVKLIPAIKQAVDMPVVADIHFDYRLAIASVEAGVDKVRINPGNIGDGEKVRAVVEACRKRSVPIRIGVNSGSLEKEILNRYGSPTPEAMCESALYHISLLEQYGFHEIAVSLKSSDVHTMVQAYRLLSAKCDYPLHLGVTEAGTERMGIIKSAAGIGSLLLDGIGDTIRVSLTDHPVKEIAAAKDILKAIGLGKGGVRFVSCPTCGRTKINMIAVAREVEERLSACEKDITVAIMGCAVNGPGEAREADIGIAGGDGCALLFRKGEILRKVKEEDIIRELMMEIERM